jgi:dTDP-glucose 4,6-dehydratase
MKLLVCGGAGFIGSAYIRNHLKNNPTDKIVNLDNLGMGSNLMNLEEIKENQNYHFIKGSITDSNLISKLVNDADIIVNFAAETHVDRSISNPTPFIETNVLGTFTILEAIRRSNKQFIHVSTDEIYGDAEGKSSFTENDVIDANNPYSATKASADILVRAYHKTYGINCIITRCSNNFGPYQFPEKLIPKTIIRAINNLKIPLYGGGEQIRSWIYVDDHVGAIEALIKKGKSGEIYNISALNEFTNQEIVKKILSIMDRPENLIETVGDRPGHDKKYSIDATKLIKTTDWKPQFDFQQSLDNTVMWYQRNTSWWVPLINEKILHPQPWTVNW